MAKNTAKTASAADALDAETDSSTRQAVRPVDDGPRGPLVRTEGQRLLLAVTDSLSTIGRAVGASKQAVSQWRHGFVVPGDVYQKELQRRYQIPIGAWAGLAVEEEEEEEAPARAAAAEERDEDEGVSITEDLERLLRVYRRQLKRGDLTPRERVQLTDGFSRTVLQKAKIEKDREMLEDRIVREHPKWKRMKRAITDALIPFPEAARAIEATIIRLLGEEDDEGRE